MRTLKEIPCGESVKVTKLTGGRRSEKKDYGYGDYEGD